MIEAPGEDLGSFFKMTGYPSFELIKAKSDPLSELGSIYVSLDTGKKKIESCNNLIILKNGTLTLHFN